MTHLNNQQFVHAVEDAITDFYDTKLMDIIDNLARKFSVEDEDVPALLDRVNTSMQLDDAWREYVE